ncbi:glmU, partial [Symbiodinium sp. CCMP2456]
MASSAGRYWALRLCPGDDLKESLLAYVAKHGLRAAAVVSCVGSLSKASLRLANADRANPNPVRSFEKRLEITSLVGTLGCEGPKGHLHLSVADE